MSSIPEQSAYPLQPDIAPQVSAAGIRRRLSRPLLLLFVFVMLFLPFLTVSCSSPFGGEMNVEFSGWDATAGTDPAVSGLNGLENSSKASGSGSADASDDTAEQQGLTLARMIFGWGFIGIVLVGAVVLFFLRSSIARSITALVVSMVAGLALVMNHAALQSYIESSLNEASKKQPAGEPGLLPDLDLANFVAVDSRWGFWVTAAYLAVFAAANGTLLGYRLRARKDRRQPRPMALPCRCSPPLRESDRCGFTHESPRASSSGGAEEFTSYRSPPAGDQWEAHPCDMRLVAKVGISPTRRRETARPRPLT